jgi:hypothetical protein
VVLSKNVVQCTSGTEEDGENSTVLCNDSLAHDICVHCQAKYHRYVCMLIYCLNMWKNIYSRNRRLCGMHVDQFSSGINSRNCFWTSALTVSSDGSSGVGDVFFFSVFQTRRSARGTESWL